MELFAPHFRIRGAAVLQIDYVLSDEWNDTLDPKSFEDMSEIDLRYSMALGNLILVVNGLDFSAPWGWIPMVDMAVALSDIRDALSGDQSALETFEFTENEASISFQKVGDAVQIAASYVPGKESIPFPELDERVREFRDKVFREATVRFRSLEKNEAFRSLYERTT
jgi:hypothetical protein